VYLPVSPPRAARAGWFAAWLAVVVVQAVLAVHSEAGAHPDEHGAGQRPAEGPGDPAGHAAGDHGEPGEHGDCGLCLAAAAGTPALPNAGLPPAAPRPAALDPRRPPVPAAIPVRTGPQARAPPT
jgi:hypothetical protein